MTETFDPLDTVGAAAVSTAVKQRVRNIIRSYNHPADLLAEPVQNAIDELDEAVRAGACTRGMVKVRIDCSIGKVSIFDNGRGISVDNVKRLLAPDVTAKAELFRNGRSRGHKGVGLTFLAYGFNFFELESRTTTEHFIVRLEHARQWVENSSIVEAPRADLRDLRDDEGELRGTGTVITVQVSAQTEPRDLHRTFPTSSYARTVLEAQTAIGVYPAKAEIEESTFDAQLNYVSSTGVAESIPLRTVYRFPHVDLRKGPRVFDVGAYMANSPGTTPPARLTKKNEAAYRFYTTDTIVEMLRGRAGGDLLSTDGDVENLLRKHSVTAYALVGYSSEYRGTLAESWSVPSNRRSIAPSVRVATDRMISSWQRDLSLTHRGFNVDRIWLVIHLIGVEPDLGRKDYPPEILELLSSMEDPLANDIAKQGEPFLIPTSRSRRPIDYEAPQARAIARQSVPFPAINTSTVGPIGYLTQPQEEQDVVALFNELRGQGLLGYFSPIFFSGDYAYDSYLKYEPTQVPQEIKNALPGNDAALPGRKREGVAEFKFDALALLPDLVRELKSWTEIRWLVCWEVSATSKTQGGLTMDVVEVDPGEDPYAGVTHIATLSNAGETTVSVISLKKLLETLSTT